ncbi:pathogenesis-related protein [Striga asiatica]|uniref:Pathogenesis-related protein n=1 Tax=Striga asiatica TaxID=4170 RepID=A0A5A7Q5Z0_STRAF|nr:pathogenesis-related protein [Striga asiatica]
MGLFKHTNELKLRVSAKRMYEAMVTETHTIPLPPAIKSSELLHGDGGAGSIRKTNLADGSHLKERIEALDNDKYASKHTVTEGAMLGEKLESIHYEQKFEDTKEGCVVKIVNEYHTKGDAHLSDEEIKAVTEQALAFYKLTEEFLLAHPQLCA